MLPAASGAALAATPTINCDTVSHRSADWATCQQLVGTASCYWANSGGGFTIALGYRNPSDSILTAAAGTTNNGILDTQTPTTFADPGRLTTFYPGTSTTAFTMTRQSNDSTVQWYLMGNPFTFSTANTPACASKPVPIMGNATAAAAVFIFLVGALGIVNRRRLAQVARSPWLRGTR